VVHDPVSGLPTGYFLADNDIHLMLPQIIYRKPVAAARLIRFGFVEFYRTE
jgi:hypothetical protein